MLFKRHTCSISLHTSVKCAVRSPDMIKLTAHFNELCSEFGHLKFCEQMWIYSWCSSRDIHGQTHCTLQLSVQWDHQTWSKSLHTSMNCAVSLITWNFVSRCGSTLDDLQETIHVQTHCTLQLSVQWVHQTWSNSLHTSNKCAVSLITWNFVSRCGSTLDALQETYMVKLTAHFS